jgi:hypothetical protein
MFRWVAFTLAGSVIVGRDRANAVADDVLRSSLKRRRGRFCKTVNRVFGAMTPGTPQADRSLDYRPITGLRADDSLSASPIYLELAPERPGIVFAVTS